MCDTLVVMADDGILFAKNSDRDPNEAQVIRWYEAADHEPGTTVDCTWTTIPQAPHTNAVLLAQPWWIWGAEMGANDHGVVIGNQGVFNRRGHAKHGLLGMDLLRLALERADTATDALSTLVDLLETHGQGGSASHAHPGFRYDNSFLVADGNEAFVLETAGREWVSEQVHGPARSISNGYTIEAFGRAHADPIRSRVAECTKRQCRTEATGAIARGALDMFAILRDHGDDTLPRYRRSNGALGAPCVHAGGVLTASQTAGSWVSDLRGGPLHWVTATAAPCTSVFKPVTVDAPVRIDATQTVTDHYDPASLWWRHELVHRHALRDLSGSLARFTPTRDRLEADWVATPPESDEAFATAENLEAKWFDELSAAELGDHRPTWLRRHWSRNDQDAALAYPTTYPTPRSAVTMAVL